MKKMSGKIEFQQKFQDELAGLFKNGAFQPGTASLQHHMKNGHGDLEEGIRTTMKIGDFQMFGRPEDAPEESSVNADYAYFCAGKEMAPLASLLPAMTVSGTEETKPGFWKVLYESEKSRLWAFLRMLANMEQAALVGNEQMGERLEKIMKGLVENLPVVIVKMQAEDELWAEWSRSTATGHTDLQHSVDRNSNRFTFFSKLKQTLKNKLLGNGEPAEITSKELFQAYQDAEKEKKFTTPKGMAGVKRDNELAQLMKWGGHLTKFGMLDVWREMEIGPKGRTVF